MPCSNLNEFIINYLACELNSSLLIKKKCNKKRFIPNILKKRQNHSKFSVISNKNKISKKNRRKQKFSEKKDLSGIIEKMNELMLSDVNPDAGSRDKLKPSPMWYVGETDNYLDVNKIEFVDSVTFYSPTQLSNNFCENFTETESSELKNLALVDNTLLDTSGLEVKVLGYLGESIDEFFTLDNLIDDQYTHVDGFRDNFGPFELKLIDNANEIVENTYLMIEMPGDSCNLDHRKFEYTVIDNFEEFNRLLNFDEDCSDKEALMDPFKSGKLIV